MNGVPEYRRAKFKQTSGGVWYCEAVEAVDENMNHAIELVDAAMTKIEDILEQHNKEPK